MAKDNKIEKNPYGIITPEEVSDREFERLSDFPSQFIRKKLRNGLDSLPGLGMTYSTGPRGALSNFFFRGNEKGLYQIVTARSLNKMFSSEADRYAFLMPEYDRCDKDGKPLTDYQANMMRAADLAYDIAEKRDGDKDKYIDVAMRLIDLERKI